MKKRTKSNLIFQILIWFFAIPFSYAQDILDPQFNGGGIVTFPGFKNAANEIVTCGKINPSNGTIYVAGIEEIEGIDYAFVASYLPNGTLNTAFNNGHYRFSNPAVNINAIDVSLGDDVLVGGYFDNGTIKLPFMSVFTAGAWSGETTFGTINPTDHAVFNTVHITSAGNYVGAGYADVSGVRRMFTAKCNNSFALDLSFETLGYFVENRSTPHNATVSVLYGDSLYVSGFIDQTVQDTLFLRKFLVEGVDQGIDSSYNGGSMVTHYHGVLGDAEPGGIAVLPDDKVIIASSVGANGAHSGKVIRFNKDATLDNTFAFAGVLNIQPLAGDLKITDLNFVTAYNRFFVTGFVALPTDQNLIITAYNNNGTGQFVFSELNLPTGTSEYTENLLYNPLTTGFHTVGSNKDANGSFDILITKMDVNANLDNSQYAPNGYITSYFTNSQDAIFGVAATNNAVYFGYKEFIISGSKYKFCKLDNQGNLATDFSSDGISIWPKLNPGDDVKSFGLLSTGELILAGITVQMSPVTEILLSKLNANGDLITTFGDGGYVMFNYQNKISDVYKILPLNNGNFVVSCSRDSSNGSRYMCLVMFDSGGNLVNTFGTGGIFLSDFVINQFELIDIVQDVDPNKIICIMPDGLQGSRIVKVIRLNQLGVVETAYGTGGVQQLSNGTDNIMGFSSMDASGNLYIPLAAETTSYSYAIAKLDNTGRPVSGFGNSGILNITQPSTSNYLSIIHVIGNNLYGVAQEGLNATIIKSDLNGNLDTNFDLDGKFVFQVIMNEEIFYTSVAGNGALFIGNGWQSPSNDDDVQITKFLTEINTSTLIDPSISLPDVNKVFGDKPFPMKATSLNPAPITYTIQGPCLSFDRDSNFVINCAGTVTVTASQAATSIFSADQATATVTIAKATPFLVFNNQGAVVGDALFKLAFTSNSDTSLALFSSAGGTSSSFILDTNEGTITPQAAGSSTVTITIPTTTNYLSVSASALVTIYLTPIPPEINPVVITNSIGDTTAFDLNQIVVGKSAPVEIKTIDLDPSTPGIQSYIKIPEYGIFRVDTTGMLSFLPNYGFTGEAFLDFVVSDRRGITSEVSQLKIVYEFKSKEEIPSLETKEVFTPNGDGLNDTFVIAFLDNTIDNSLVVYDRNGHEVFQVSDYRNDWTGKDQSGKVLDSGV
nr:gliding motility-associated C-terminal domain-containing protein [Cytophagaceae bacterium]